MLRADAGAVDVNAEQLAQRRVVEQRLRRRQHEAAGDQREHPVKARAQHVHGIDVEHLLRAEVGPHPLQACDGAAPVVRFGCQHSRGDRAGGCPDDHRGMDCASAASARRAPRALRPDKPIAHRRPSEPAPPWAGGLSGIRTACPLADHTAADPECSPHWVTGRGHGAAA